MSDNLAAQGIIYGLAMILGAALGLGIVIGLMIMGVLWLIAR